MIEEACGPLIVRHDDLILYFHLLGWVQCGGMAQKVECLIISPLTLPLSASVW